MIDGAEATGERSRALLVGVHRSAAADGQSQTPVSATILKGGAL
jgi:hypothetical protein